MSGRRWRPTGPAGPTNLSPQLPWDRCSWLPPTVPGPGECVSPDPSTGQALLDLALMVGLLVVVLVLMLMAVLGGAADL